MISPACQKPQDVGWAPEFWTTALLARYMCASNATAAGQPSAARVVNGTISKILAAHDRYPHRVQYYLARRDPAVDQKMVQVLHVYAQVTWGLDQERGPTQRALVV